MITAQEALDLRRLADAGQSPEARLSFILLELDVQIRAHATHTNQLECHHFITEEQMFSLHHILLAAKFSVSIQHVGDPCLLGGEPCREYEFLISW